MTLLPSGRIQNSELAAGRGGLVLQGAGTVCPARGLEQLSVVGCTQGTEYSLVASPPVWAVWQKQDSREGGEGDTATIVKKQNHVKDWPGNQAES